LKHPWILQLVGDRIHVADANNRRIQVLSVDGKYEGGYKVPVNFGKGMAFDAQGNLYLSTQGLRSTNLIAVYDRQGNLYILLSESSRMIVYVFANDGMFKGKLVGIDDSIYRIAISHRNDLYALSQDTHFIYKFELD
jgi:hypothetical protein